MTRPVIAAALVLAAVLQGCDDGAPVTAPSPAATEAAEIAARAEAFATRCDLLVERPWAARLEFPKRIHVRRDQARAFSKEAGADVSPALVERGRKLLLDLQPFESAFALLDRLGRSIEEIAGHQRLIEVHMKALEQGGEAPFRIRIDHLGQDAGVGFKHLDDALARIVAKAPDADTHEKIATGTMRRVHETAMKLGAEVKAAATRATDAEARAKLLAGRIAWADRAAAAATTVPAEAMSALTEARAFATGLPPRQAEVLQSLRNARPEGITAADALAAEVDQQVERLTRAFIDIARKAGVQDP